MRYPLLIVSAWLLFLATDLLAPQSARTTSITFVNLDGPGEGFNDATPVAPVGDNTGTTLGAQRQIAAQFAADIWADFISSKVPILVDAKFDAPNSEHPAATDPFNSLDCTKNPPVIATAEPTTYHGNFAKAPKTNTWYPQALANSLAGKDLSVSSDIRAYFNSSVGTPQCLPDKSWYYGLDGNAQPDQFDFVTVVLRELAHGLGFITTVNLNNGQKLGGFDDVFSLKLKDVSTELLFSQMTDAERLIAIRNTGNLRWVGDNVVAAHGGDMPMYAPPDIDVDFSVSNWHTSLQSGSVTIEAGFSTALITVTPIDDALEESSETVILTLSPDSAYTVDSPSSVTVTIADNDLPPRPTVTIESNLPEASETGPTAGQFTVSRTGSTISALTVNYAIGGTALNGIDYTTLSGSVIIGAGSSTAPIDVTPIDDALGEGTETVILTLRANPAYVVGTPGDVMVTITDSDSTPLPAVSIVASLPEASEAGPTPTAGQFTVSRTGSTAAQLKVNFTIGGTAINGTDYGSLQSPVTINAGSSTATIDVTPVNDSLPEASETVTLTLSSGAYTVISPSTATVTIADNDSPASLPTVTIESNLPEASETGPIAGQFTVTRNGSTAAALTVHYKISGTATNGIDYNTSLPLPTSVTILAGSSTALITINPDDDALVEGNEVVVLSLLANAAYTRGSPSSATVTIADNDLAPPLPAVSITTNLPNASETGPTAGQFTVSRTGSTASPLTVNYAIDGTATNGTDYMIDPHELVEPFYTTPNQLVGLALEVLADIGWPLDPGGTVKITALDDAVKEGTTTGFTVHRTGATDQAITVRYKISGKAKNGTDYETLLDPGDIHIPAGESSATITVMPFFDDVTKEGDETVIVTLQPDPDPIQGPPKVPHYTLGFPSAASLKIQNNVVKFGAGAAPAGEVGVPYNFDIPVSGGEEPYDVTKPKGDPPPGLTRVGLTIQGTPTQATTSSFTIKVTDQQGVSVSKAYKIKILKHVSITTDSLSAGTVNRSYTATLKATGGKLKYTWTLDALTPLPSGLSLSANGVISGTPATGTAGLYHPKFKVTDALGGTHEKTLTLTIN